VHVSLAVLAVFLLYRVAQKLSHHQETSLNRTHQFWIWHEHKNVIRLY